MTDNQTPADLDIRAAKPSILGRLSLVWIVPILALAVSLGVAWQNYQDRGTSIEISFENASGITTETVIKYRDVTVGEVENVEFAEGLGEVIVTARIDKEIWPYLDDDAEFWVVRPDVSVRGITGLDTVLGGVYIEGNWDTTADVAQYQFTGLESPSLTLADQEGIQIVLRATDGSSLSKGAPILHKGIKVGYLEAPQLSFDGREVRATAFIEAPHDARITTATRFWDTSGFSVSVGAAGLSLDVDSIASLIEGGIAFDTVVSGGLPISGGKDVFDIYDNEESARNSLFVNPDRELLELGMFFSENVSGLSKGSEVYFRGLQIGEVKDLAATVLVEDGAQTVQLRTSVLIEPARLGMGNDATADDALALLSELVTQGLRARLISGGLLTGNLIVELYEVENAELRTIDTTSDTVPIIPTTASEISDVAATAENMLARIESLPIEDLMSGAIDLMDSIEIIARSEGLQSAPDELLAILSDVRTLVASEAIQGVPADIDAIIAQIDGAISNVNVITEQAFEADVVGQITSAIAAAERTIENLDAATGNLPEILAQIETLAAKTNALDIDGLVNQTTATLASIDALIGDDATVALPSTVNDALNEVRGLVSDFRTGGSADNLNAALASASEAAKAVETAVFDLPALSRQASTLLTNIDTALIGLPTIMAELEALTTKANGVEIEALVVQTTQTLDSIETLVANEDTAALPASLSAALDEMRAVIGEIRDGGAINNANEALNSANEAARAIERAAETLPALTQRANQLAAQTAAILDSYGERSRFNAETLSTLRDIQSAADAVTSLARTIQRNPSSLLTGR
jgi:paraquat-inducible protein B